MDKNKDDKTNLITLFNWYRLKRINEFASQCDKEQAWKQIQAKIDAHARIRMYRRWMGAAAVLLCILATGLWYLYGDVHISDLYHKESRFIQKGEQMAMLVADDGSQYHLFSDDGSVVNEKGIQVARNTGRELVYDVRSTLLKDAGNHLLDVPRGGEYRLVLTDGTHIHLNAESRLSYPVIFNHLSREVYLRGEAFFEVAKDEKKPFLVHTSLGDIEVLGTKFNVSTYGEEQVVVTLEEGSVKVTYGSREEILSPGEQAVIKDQTVDVSNVHVENYTSWSTGVYEYIDTPLATIVRQLSRWYDVDMVFADPHLGERRFAGVIFRDQPLQYAVDILSRVSDVCFISKGKTIEITDKEVR